MNRCSLCIFVFVFTCACSSETVAPVDPRVRLIESWWANYLKPELESLRTATEIYRNEVETFCERRDGPAAARDAWGVAHRHVKRQQFFRFGPYVEFPERYLDRIDLWPAKPDAIDERLANAAIAFSQTYFDSAVSTVRGFPAASYVLFSDDIDERDCEFLVGNANDVALQTAGLFDVWDPEQGGYYTVFQVDMKPADAAAELVNRLWHQTENVSKNNIFEPMGLQGDGTPQPENLEARFTDRSVAVMQDTFETIDILYAGNADVVGVSQSVASADLDARIKANINDVTEKLRQLDGPMSVAIVSERDALKSVLESLDTLQVLLEVDLLTALGFARSFNDQDGD